MSKKISNAVALSVLMVLTVTLAAVPAGAIVQATQVDVRGEVYQDNTGGNAHVPHTNGGLIGWDAYNFAGFWYDLKEGKLSETMYITNNFSSIDNLAKGTRTIAKDDLYYNSQMQIIQYKVNEANASTNFVDRGLLSDGSKASASQNAGYYGKLGWFAQPYVALNGKPNKLAQLIIEQGTSSSEKKSLTVGETWDIGGGWTLTAQSIDAKATPRQAWLVLSKDGVKKDDKVIMQGQVYTYTEKSIAGESDVPLFVTYVDSVFAGATSDMVQLRYTWAISTSVTEVKTSDTYGVFKVIDDGSSAPFIIKLWNDESSVSLSTDSTVNLAGQMNFQVADNDSVLRFYPLVMYTDPGTYEMRGEVYQDNTGGNAHVPHTKGAIGWDAYNFAGFWYDLKEGKMSENMVITNNFSSADNLAKGTRTIAKDDLYYNSQMQIIQYKVNEANASTNFVDRGLLSDGSKASASQNAGYYGKLGWFAQPYVALNGKPNKLAQLIIEQGTSSSEKKSLTVGETWDIGGGWTLTAQSIDAKATPRQAWLVLSKDGVKKDDKVIMQGQVYTYTEKSIAGESDVPLFVTYVDSVFAGATSDMVQLRYTWAISTSVTEVKTSDTYGVFKVIDDGSSAPFIIKLWNDESSVSLSTDSTVNLAGEMNFRVADNDSVLRFYPVVDYQVGPTNITPPTTGTVTSTATVNATAPVNVTETVTPLGGTSTGTETATPVTSATAKPTPAFESVFAIAGLLAVAFLVLRQRK
jgi:S-layer protein (TIGR01567 family)